MGAYDNVLTTARRRRFGNPDEANGTIDETIRTEGAYGDAATADYLNRAGSFDASKALDTYARGAWGGVSQLLGRQLEALKGQSVGAGRFDSGLFDEDQGRVVQAVANDFTSNLAMQSLNAAGMDQRNTEGIGRFASEMTGRADDLSFRRYEQVNNDARDEEERRRNRRRGIASAIGTVLGAGVGGAFGGGAGAKIGAGIGGAAGGMF